MFSLIMQLNFLNQVLSRNQIKKSCDPSFYSHNPLTLVLLKNLDTDFYVTFQNFYFVFWYHAFSLIHWSSYQQ